MLKSWGLTNFKSIHKADLELAPLTVLTGTNSSGKSTLIQSILLIAQTMQNQFAERSLVLNGNLVDLGQFDEIITNVKSDDGENKRKREPVGIKWEIKCKGNIARTKYLLDAGYRPANNEDAEDTSIKYR